MRISVVNLTSDSSDNEDSQGSHAINSSKYICERDSQNFCCENELSDAEQRVPLFKIIFKDERTSRIYRKRLEDILNYLVAGDLREENISNSTDLVLEVYEPTENSNTTITDITTEQSRTPVIDYNDPNNNYAFNIEKGIESMNRGGSNSENNNVLHINPYGQTNQQANFFGAFNWGVLQHTQPQVLQQCIVQPNCPTTVNFNTKKRKWEDDSDLPPVLRKKKKVDCVSECVLHLENSSVMLSDSQTNASETSFYDPVWWGSNNTGNIPTESMCWEKIEDSYPQAEMNSTPIMNQNLSVTFNYRVLKVGTFGYTKKRTVSISKDGIELCAHHLSETSALVRVNIGMADIVQILVSFSKILPALFLYITENAATMVKEALGMNDDSIAYFDPQSTDDNCNKIIILPDNMIEICKILKKLLEIGLVEKLDKETADILLRNSFSKPLEKQGPLTRQVANKLYLKLASQCIRIGTYKCANMRFDIMISTKGFQFNVPKVDDDEIFKRITISFTEIEKMYFSLEKVCAIFLHVNSCCAQRIRSLIEMPDIDTREVYFDPESESIAKQRLVIIFNKIMPPQQETLKILLSYTHAAEISLKKIIHQMLFNHM